MEQNEKYNELFKGIISLEKAMMDHLEKIDELLDLLVKRVKLTETNIDGINKELEILFGKVDGDKADA